MKSTLQPIPLRLKAPFALTVLSICSFVFLSECRAAQQDLSTASLFDVVHKIEAARHVKSAAVEDLTGRHLTSHGYWHSTSDRDEAALVPQVEMTNDSHGTTNSVLLFVSHNLHVSADDVKHSFGAHPKQCPHPEPALKNVSFSYVYERSSGWTSFWFEGSGPKADLCNIEVTYK